MKIGFVLMPAALEGLGRISHLINIDTVEDLLVVLKNIVVGATSLAPYSVRLQCVHCALLTLAGPGQELNFDDDVFINCLRLLMNEAMGNIQHWHLVLECVELSVIKRREIRNSVIYSFVNQLLYMCPHLGALAAATTLALVHGILLRYPRNKSNFAAFMANGQVGAQATRRGVRGGQRHRRGEGQHVGPVSAKESHG